MIIFLLGSLNIKQNPGYLIITETQWHAFAINQDDETSKETSSEQKQIITSKLKNLTSSYSLYVLNHLRQILNSKYSEEETTNSTFITSTIEEHILPQILEQTGDHYKFDSYSDINLFKLIDYIQKLSISNQTHQEQTEFKTKLDSEKQRESLIKYIIEYIKNKKNHLKQENSPIPEIFASPTLKRSDAFYLTTSPKRPREKEKEKKTIYKIPKTESQTDNINEE